MHTLPDVVTSLEEVAEPVRQFYVEGEGGFKLSSIKELKNSTAHVKRELSEVKTKYQELERAHEPYAQFSLEQIQTWAEKSKDLENFDGGVELKNIKDEMSRSWGGKLELANKEAMRYKSAAEHIQRQHFIESALDRHGVNEQGRTYLAGNLAQSVRLEWDGDRLNPRIVDKDGKPAMTDDTYDPKTIDHLIEEHKKSAPFFFDSQYKGRGGSGADNAPSNPNDERFKAPPGAWDFATIAAYEKIQGKGSYAKYAAAYKPEKKIGA